MVSDNVRLYNSIFRIAVSTCQKPARLSYCRYVSSKVSELFKKKNNIRLEPLKNTKILPVVHAERPNPHREHATKIDFTITV